MKAWYRYPIQDNLIEQYKLKVTERNTKSTTPHWHDFYELEIILNGVGTTNINGKEYPLAPNTLCLLTPADYHSYHVEDDREITVINLTFSPDCIEDLSITELITLTNYIFCEIDSNDADRLVFLIKKIKAEYSSANYLNKKYITGLMSCILIELLRFQKNQPKLSLESQSFPLPVQKALYFIRSHFREHITLEDVARFSGFSSNHMSKIFHRSFGMGFKEYLIALRLNHAEQLLLLSDESITEIAYFCGFNSISHFLHVFKAKYDISPLQFRKKGQKNFRADLSNN